jgi:predicted dehydrogenase
MKSRPLRVGLLGTGVAAWRLYKPAFEELGARLQLVACANRTRAKASKFAKASGFSRVEPDAGALFAAADIDAVILSLPIDVQAAFVLEALRSGKAVLSEKPVAASLGEAESLIQAARELPSPWMVGENFAFMSHVRKLEALARTARFGRIRLVETRQMIWMDRTNPYFHTPWRAKPRFAGGFLVDGGVHVAHVVNRCFGAPRVTSALQANFEPTLEPIDTAVALLRFESGALGTWTSCFTARDRQGPLLRVLGETANAALYYDRLEVTTAKGKTTITKSRGDSFAAQFEHFADVVQRGKALDVTPEQALADLRLVSAVCGITATSGTATSGGTAASGDTAPQPGS